MKTLLIFILGAMFGACLLSGFALRIDKARSPMPSFVWAGALVALALYVGIFH